MGQYNLLLVGFALLTSNAIVESITVSSRRFASCGFMESKIYCYGGKTSAVQSGTVDNTLYSLNITQLFGKNTESINNNWELVVPSEPFDTEIRRIPNAIVLADGKRLFIHGGYGDTKLSNQTIIYDATTNTWQSTSPYIEGDHGIRQIYSAAVVNLPDGDVGFYGGFEQFANADVPRVTDSGEIIEYWKDENITFVGFPSMQTYSPVTASWRSFNPQTGIPEEGYYFQEQTATLDADSGLVYFLGGTYVTLIDQSPKVVPFNRAYTFNTNSGIWLRETLSGKVSYNRDIPSPRQYHTADLLPNSRDIIIYGGTDGTDPDTGTASIDYCFTLNLESKIWTEQTSKLHIPSNISGPRFSHSSVLVNTTLFIIFGKGGSDGTLQNQLIAIDVADVANISYSAIIGPPSDSMTPPKDDDMHKPSSGLSKGAVGGIAAGAAVAVLAIIAAVICFVRRKRKLNEVEEREKRNKSNEEEVHVDWDIIDEQYREVSPVDLSTPNVPDSTNLASSGKNSQRLFSNGVGVVKPSIDTERSHSVVKPSIDIETGHYAIKPDAVQD